MVPTVSLAGSLSFRCGGAAQLNSYILTIGLVTTEARQRLSPSTAELPPCHLDPTMASPNDDPMAGYVPGMYEGFVPIQQAYPPHMAYEQYNQQMEAHMQMMPMVAPYNDHHLPSSPPLPSTYDVQNTLPSSGALLPEMQASSASASPRYLPSNPRPFTCTEQGCTSANRSFRRKGDLERHMNTVHRRDALQMWDCWLPRCPRKESGPRGGFSRKDHLIEHVRYVHHIDIPKNRRATWRTNERYADVHECPVQHCKRKALTDEGGFESQELLFEHMMEEHGFPSWLFPLQKGGRTPSASQTPEDSFENSTRDGTTPTSLRES